MIYAVLNIASFPKNVHENLYANHNPQSLYKLCEIYKSESHKYLVGYIGHAL